MKPYVGKDGLYIDFFSFAAIFNDSSPHVIIAEEEKIIVETVKGSETVIEEK